MDSNFIKKKQFINAGRYFYCAIKIDKGYALAHYNYACILALLSAQNKSNDECDDSFNFPATQHLAKSIQLDKSRRKRMLKDSDLNAIKSRAEFIILTFTKNTPVRTMLIKIKNFYGPAPGVYPSMIKMKFFHNNKVTVQFREFDKNQLCCKTNCEDGTYSLKGNSIINIKFKDRKIKSMRGKINVDIDKNIIKNISLDFGDPIWNLNPFEDKCSA